MSGIKADPTGVAPTSIGRATARGLAGLSAARVISMVLQLVMFAALAGHLGEAGLGLFGFGLAAAHLFDVVANLGFKAVVTRDIAQDPTKEAWLIPNYLYIRTLLGGVALLGLTIFVFVSGYEADQREVALIAGSLLILTAPQAAQPILEVRLRMGWIAAADVIEASLMLSGTLLLISTDASVTDFLWLYVATNVLNSVLIVGASLNVGRGLDWRPQPKRWGKITRSAFVLGVASVFISIYYQIDIALLARLKPDVEVGNYSAAFQALAAVNVVPAVLSTVLSPVLARSVQLGREVLQRRYSLIVHFISVLAVPVAVGGALTAWRFLPEVPRFEEFGRGGVALSILSVAAGLIFVTTIVQATLIAAHLQRKLLSLAMFGAMTNLVLNILVIPRYSLYGAAAATVVTEAAVLVRSQQLVGRHLGVDWPVARTLRLAAPALGMVVVALVTDDINVFAQMALAGLTFVAIVVAAGVLRPDDLGALVGKGEGSVEVQLVPRGRARAGINDGPESNSVVIASPGFRPTLLAVDGFQEAHLRSAQSLSLSTLLGARAAGVRRLVAHRTTPLGPVERWMLRQLADEVRGVDDDPASEVSFISEGALGSGVLGHLTVYQLVSNGLERTGVRHDGVLVNGPESFLEKLAVRSVPILGTFDLDLHPLRWHLVMAHRTRRRLRDRQLSPVLIFDGHTIAMGAMQAIRRRPTFVMVDATMRQWTHLAIWRKVWPWTDLGLLWAYRRERRIFRSATVLAFSEWAAAGVRREVPDSRIVLYSPGVDTDRFVPVPRPATGATSSESGPIRILFVGARFAEKGGGVLLEATEALRPDRVVLHIVTRDDVQEQPGVVVHRVQHHEPQLVELHQQADIFVLPTRADGSPNTILEAMATGTPVISTAVGAIPSLIGEAGMTVEPGSVAALQDAIEVLVSDSERRASMGLAGRARAEEHFAAKRQAEKLCDLIREQHRIDA